MTRSPAVRAATAVVAAGLLAGLLAGCSSKVEAPEASGPGTTDTPTASAPTVSTDPAESPYLSVPAGVELTAPGTALEVGDAAVVAWQPRQDLVGALRITVRRLERTTFKRSFAGWQLDGAVAEAAPYFVHVRVENVGETDLGRRAVPLYVVDGTNALVEYSTFEGTFEPCDSQGLPPSFGPGATVDRCLVYLAPRGGQLAAVSFRPTQEFDPITWSGRVHDLAEPARAKKGRRAR